MCTFTKKIIQTQSIFLVLLHYQPTSAPQSVCRNDEPARNPLVVFTEDEEQARDPPAVFIEAGKQARDPLVAFTEAGEQARDPLIVLTGA